MNWNDFFKSLKDGQYQSVYLFSGPEEYNKREALEALRRALLPAGLEQLNEMILDGANAQTIIDSAETLPVMCDRRIVVVRDWAPLLAGKSKNTKDGDGDSKAKEPLDQDSARMLQWLENPPSTCCLVFYMTQALHPKKKLAVTLRKLDGYVEFDYLSGSALSGWCAQQLKPLGKRIRQAAIDEMTLMAGSDLTRLSGELNKLAAYVGEAAEIDVSHVRAVVSPSPEYSVFMILDHLLAGRLAEATEVVNTVLLTEAHPVRIISLIGGQLRLNAHMKYAMERGGNLAEVQNALGVTSGRAWHIKKQIAAVKAETFENLYRICVDTEYAVKSGAAQERAAMNLLLLKISQAKTATK